jgi:hypothetical protein
MAGVFPTSSSPSASASALPAPISGSGNFPFLTLSNEFVKVRFVETDVPYALNQRWIGMPRGVYLGFIPSAASGSRIVSFAPDATQNFSLLRVPSRDLRVMVDIFYADTLTLDFTAHNVWPVYVLATASYQKTQPTHGKIFTRATPANSFDEITVCKVNKVGNDLVIDTTVPTMRNPPIAFATQPYGYMPDGSIGDLATTNATVAEVIAARSSGYTGPHASVSARVAADMSGTAMADRLGLRMVHLLSNNHPNKIGPSFNVSGSFSDTNRAFGPNLTIEPSGSESSEGALTDGIRDHCFVINGTTGQRIVNPVNQDPVFGRVGFSSGTNGVGKEIQFVNASVDVNGNGSNPFVAPLQQGDLVLGPDGRYYELETIVDPDNAVLGTAFQGVNGSVFNTPYRRWTLFLFTVAGGPYALPALTTIQFLFPCFFRVDRAIFDGFLYIKRDGDRPPEAVATPTVEGKALLAAASGLVGSIRTIRSGPTVIGNDAHTLNFPFGGAINAGGGVVNVSVTGATGPTGPASNQGPAGPTGAAGFGYNLNNSYEQGTESGTTVVAGGPVTVSHTVNWTTTPPNFTPQAPRSYAHVTGGWGIIDGFSAGGFERIHIDALTTVDANTTRITYRIQPDGNVSFTTIACFMGACQ